MDIDSQKRERESLIDPITEYVAIDKTSSTKNNVHEICSVIARELFALGLGSKHHSTIVSTEMENCFGDMKDDDEISEKLFIERALNSTSFIFCFDLLHFILKHTMECIKHYLVSETDLGYAI